MMNITIKIKELASGKVTATVSEDVPATSTKAEREASAALAKEVRKVASELLREINEDSKVKPRA